MKTADGKLPVASLEQTQLDVLNTRVAELEAKIQRMFVRLCKLDQCAGGHDWITLPDPNGITMSIAHIRCSQEISQIPFADLRMCRRCRGVFWHDVPLEVVP